MRGRCYGRKAQKNEAGNLQGGMDSAVRDLFNHHDPNRIFETYRDRLYGKLGVSVSVAETPLFLTPTLRDASISKTAAVEIAGQPCRRRLRSSRRRSPRTTTRPEWTRSRTACKWTSLCRDERGELVPRLVELQAFPSLYALEMVEAEMWASALNEVPELRRDWTCFFESREHAMSLMRRSILGGNDPMEVALVDYQPEKQKTSPDFTATKVLFDVDSVCACRSSRKARSSFASRTANASR